MNRVEKRKKEQYCPNCGSPQIQLRSVKKTHFMDAISENIEMPGFSKLSCRNISYEYEYYKCMVKCGNYFTLPISFADYDSKATFRMENYVMQVFMLHPLSEVYATFHFAFRHDFLVQIQNKWMQDVAHYYQENLLQPEELIVRSISLEHKEQMLLFRVFHNHVYLLDMIQMTDADSIRSVCESIMDTAKIKRVWIQANPYLQQTVKSVFPCAKCCMIKESLSKEIKRLLKETGKYDPDAENSEEIYQRIQNTLKYTWNLEKIEKMIESFQMNSRFEFELQALFGQFKDEVLNGAEAELAKNMENECKVAEKYLKKTMGCESEAIRFRMLFGDTCKYLPEDIRINVKSYPYSVLEQNLTWDESHSYTLGVSISNLQERICEFERKNSEINHGVLQR